MSTGQVTLTPRDGIAAAGGIRRRGLADLIVAPPVLFMIVSFVAPLLLLAAISLTREFPLNDAVSAINYVKIVSQAYYLDHAVGTLVFGLVVTGLCVLLGYPMAYYLVRHARSAYDFMMLAIISPLLVGVVVRSVGWVILLGTEGLFNDALRFAGLGTVKILFTSVAAVIGMVHVLLPFMIISIASVLSKLDWSLEEAAQSLGASGGQVFWKVIVPLSIPGVSAGAFLIFALALGAYITPVLLGGGKMRIISPLIYQEITATANWSMGAALSIVLVAVVLLFLGLTHLVGRRRGPSA